MISSSYEGNSQDRLEQVLAERQGRVHATTSQSLGGLMQASFAQTVGMLALFGCAFFNLADLSTGEADKVSLDLQVFVKLGFLGLLGIYGGVGLLSDTRTRKLLTSLPVMWVSIIFCFYALSVFGSITPKESMVSTISIACVLLGTVRAIVQMGLHVVLKLVFWASATFIFCSWFLFIFMPHIGVFHEPIEEGQFIARMSGMAHPNTLGQFAGLTVVMGFLLYKVYGEYSIWRVLIVVIAFAALIGSVSRSSLMATIVALAVVYRSRVFERKNVVFGLWLGVVGLMTLMLLAVSTDVGSMIESKLGLMTKSGNAEELTTGTGRADIWAYATKLIFERPLTGYGAATSKWYMSDYSHYTHNMILNVAFSTGVFGGLACLLMVFGRFAAFFKRENAVADALAGFVLINGFAENVAFSFLCGLPTIVLILALAATQEEALEKDRKEGGGALGSSRLLGVGQ